MPPASPALQFETGFEPRTGTAVPIAPRVARITAPNAGPYTFKGTNTYILGKASLAIVDPGPLSAPHLNALIAHVGGRPIEAVLLTHTHRDHSALAHAFRTKFDTPLWFGGAHRPSRPRRLFEIDWVARESDYGLVPDRVFHDGERLTVAGIDLEVVATPGHCANHLCFGLAGTDVLLSGDHVMGWNSTMIAVPDGSMAQYFDSLRKLIALPYRQYLPGHGGPVANGPDYARALLAHREMRNEQVVQTVNEGARSIGHLASTIYPSLAAALLPAARMTLRAHVEYLADLGRIRATRGVFGLRLSPA